MNVETMPISVGTLCLFEIDSQHRKVIFTKFEENILQNQCVAIVVIMKNTKIIDVKLVKNVSRYIKKAKFVLSNENEYFFKRINHQRPSRFDYILEGKLSFLGRV